MKYELTKNFIEHNGKKLYQIKALKNFGYVRAGDLGGYIEKESNLSQEGYCWVYDEAKVYGYAKVYDNAEVSGNAEVYGNAKVYENAYVRGYAQVSGNYKIGGFSVTNIGGKI